MRLTTVILIASLMQVSAATFGQRITINQKNAALESVLKEIRKQSGYDFYYDDKTIPESQKISINIKNAGLEEALNKAFIGLSLVYEIDGKIVSIKKKEEPSFLERLADRWNAVDLRGVILDEKGQPLSGASVKVKGTNKSVSTNYKGEFFLQGVNENAVLLISYIGYQTKEVTAGSNLNEIKLELSLSKLDEVQVIAYGTTTQRYNVGSVSKVTAEEIAQQPVGNILQALAGRVPGLVVNQMSGLPGGAFTIQVRGQNAVKPTGGSGGFHPVDQPLIIIDGVPFATQNSSLNQYRSLGGSSDVNTPYGGISPLNSINPSDIESIEVLKDADATAIYGSRGSNGVVLITTKKGKAGKTEITTNINHSISTATRTIPMMNTKEYLLMRKEALKNDNVVPTPSNSPDLLILDTTKYTDWNKYFLEGSAKTTDINLSASGGTEQTSFLIGSGFRREQYLIPGNFSNQRGTVNVNINHHSRDRKLSLGLSALYGFDKSNSANGTNGLNGFKLIPNFPDLLNSDGSIRWSYNGYSLERPISNPIQYLKQKYNVSTNNLISSLLVSYQLFPGLSIKSSFGFNKLESNENAQLPKEAQLPRNNTSGTSSFGTNDTQSWIIEPQADYKANIGNGKLNVLIGGTFQRSIGNTTNLQGSNYTDDALLGTIGAAGAMTFSSNFRDYKYAAAFARINYVWQDKYIFNFTGRRDGSSRFGPGRRFGNFGSAGLGWLFSNESFISNKIPLLSYGKLRASYGTTGGDAIGDYQYYSNWTLTPTTYQGTRGYIPSNLYNPDFGWAVTKKMETAIELGFFEDKLLFTTTWFQNRSGNQLVDYLLPIQTGFGSVTKNFEAKTQNTGWEFQVSSTNIKNKNFIWESSFNLSILRNKLLEFPNIESSSYSTLYVVGQSLNLLRKVRYAGVNEDTGVFQFYDSNNVVTYNPEFGNGGKDNVIIGNSDPKFYGGFRNSFSYKGIQLDLFFEFRKQIAPNFLSYIYGGNNVGSRFSNQPSELLKSRWQQPGDKAIYQKFSQDNSMVTNAGLIFRNSDAAYSDASYIRLKTASISYQFPKEILAKVNISNARVFVNMQNLFVITKYKGGDPETHNFGGVPPLRTVAAGLQFTF